MVPKLEVNGRPNVAENWEGGWSGKKVGSEAGKSGSRAKKGYGVEGGWLGWRTAIGWGTVTGSDRAGAGDRAEAGRGKQSSET